MTEVIIVLAGAKGVTLSLLVIMIGVLFIVEPGIISEGGWFVLGWMGLFFKIFPESWQAWMTRIFGLCVSGIGGLVLMAVLSANTVQADMERMQDIDEAFRSYDHEYVILMDEGNTIHVRHNDHEKFPDYGDDAKFLEVNLDEYDDEEADDVARELIDKADAYFANAQTAGASAPDPAILGNPPPGGFSIQPAGGMPPGAAGGANHSAPASPATETIADADGYIQSAGLKWNKGDFQGAVTDAEKAYEIKKRILGAQHPDTMNVQRMIQAARQKANTQSRSVAPQNPGVAY